MEGMSDEVAVVFDDDPAAQTVVMLKHGPPEKIKIWWNATRKAYRESGNGDFCRYFKMVEGKLDLEELNKCISSSGYRPTFLPRVRVTPGVSEP